MHHTLAATALSLTALALTSGATAEWADDPAANLVISTVPGPNAQPKIVATADGGCYISWFGGSGFDVRLQRLDAAGTAQWADDGILVADRSFSSTQDYGLAIDPSGNALLAFRDDRFGGTRITAQKIAPDGSTPWGENGVQFDDGVTFVAAPKITAGPDDEVFVGWSRDVQTRIQKLDASGELAWKSPTELPNPEPVQILSDLNAAHDGTVIASSVCYVSFLGAKHLYARKVAADGTPAWPEWTAVLDGGSLQTANFPTFVSDGAGGAVFTWYTVSPLQCWVQRLDSDGAELFAHDGVPVSTDNANARVSPSVAFVAADESIYVAWRELRANQSENGIYAQRFDASGARQWGDIGLEITPITGDQLFSVTTLADGAGASFHAIEELGFGDDRVRSTAVDPAGATRWTPAVTEVSTAPEDKSRLQATLAADGVALLTWSNDDGAETIQAQNVNGDGTLGPMDDPCAPDFTGDGMVDGADLGILLGAWGTDAGDLNDDGTTDGADLGILLGDWGPCV